MNVDEIISSMLIVAVLLLGFALYVFSTPSEPTIFCRANEMELVIIPKDQSFCIDKDNTIHRIAYVKDRFVFVKEPKQDEVIFVENYTN